MTSSIFQFVLLVITLTLFSCTTSQPVLKENNEIKSKIVDGVEIYFIGDIPQYEINPLESTDSNDNESHHFDLKGRKIIKRNWRALLENGGQSSWKGKVAVKICINREGIVKYAEILPEETTATDIKGMKRSLIAARGYLYEADENSAPEECGKLVFNMDTNANSKN